MATTPNDEGYLLRQLVDGITDYAIYMLDATGNITTWNTGSTRLKGYTAGEVLGSSFAIFFTPEDRAGGLPQALLERAARAGHAQDEGWRMRKDGTSFWALESITAVYGPGGEVAGFAKVTRDRTEARQFGERIRRLNRLYAVLSEINQAIVRIRDLSTLFDHACGVIVRQGGLPLVWIGLVDPEGMAVRVVAFAGDGHGYVENLNITLDPATSPGQGPTAIAVRTGVYAVVEDIATDPRMAYWREEAVRRGFHAGASFPLAVSGVVRGVLAVYAAEPYYFDAEEIRLLHELSLNLSIAMAFDEHEQQRRRHALQLAENEQRYRSLFEQSPDAIFVNQGQRVVLANQACLHLFAASKAEQIIGLPILKLFHPAYWDAIAARVTIMLEQGRPVSALEEKIVRLDGEVVDVEVKAAPFVHDGAPAIHVILRDITERKQAEAQLRRLAAELEQRVAERTAELQARNRELEAFTYSVSHDLKAPLRGIEGYARFLAEDYGTSLDDEGRRFLAGIRRATDQMSRLIEDLLTYSRVERRAVQPGLVDLPALVTGLLEERAPDLESRRAAVHVAVLPDPITADPESLAQALRNLLDNALKFAAPPQDGTARPTIEIGAHRIAAAVQLWVKDNGIGFDMTYHDRIFDIFQRLHTRDEYPGTGVGLAIVRRAVERMGGRAWATSTPGQGATFYLEIPQPQ